MNPIYHSAKDDRDLADIFARQLIEWVNGSIDEKFHLALSGGKTPSLLFSLLAEKYRDEVPWHKIHFWWGDERMVAPDDPESNFGVVNHLLFSRISLKITQIHRILGENDPLKETKYYGDQINSVIPIKNHWPEFDLIMLGLGDDGHTASIFPDQMKLLDSKEITAIAFHPITHQPRITLTGKVLNNAKKVVFLVSGVSKAEIFNEIVHESSLATSYPAFYIRPSGELHWFVDQACMKTKIGNK